MPDDRPRRKTGRKPIDPSDPDPSAKIGLRVGAKHYDAIYQAAHTARCSVPEVIRRVLRRHIPPGPPNSGR